MSNTSESIFKSYLSNIIKITTICISLMSMPGTAETHGSIGETLMEHVSDGHIWQPIPMLKPIVLKDISLFNITIPITKHVVMLWIVAFSILITMIGAFNKVRIIPNRLGSFFEPIVLFVRDGLIYPSMGKQLGDTWFPYLLTLFFFLLYSNVLGLIPLFSTITSNLSITAALAIPVFISVVVQGMIKNGVIGFFVNMVPSGLPKPIGAFLLLIEIPGLLIRNAVLAIRLFANMIAGHFVIFSLLILIFIIHPIASAVSLPLALFISLLEVLVALIQAVVFTMLTAIFISMASSHH